MNFTFILVINIITNSALESSIKESITFCESVIEKISTSCSLENSLVLIFTQESLTDFDTLSHSLLSNDFFSVSFNSLSYIHDWCDLLSIDSVFLSSHLISIRSSSLTTSYNSKSCSLLLLEFIVEIVFLELDCRQQLLSFTLSLLFTKGSIESILGIRCSINDECTLDAISSASSYITLFSIGFSVL
ncbi:hypothetical protein AGLY_010096 [Aphis glycines]|uniref:Uncharacterized protein n=1 Tax=Aphis glycines TaxID=307491 RepID=A0A6G0TH85_APHGL|nr:hypothetical protein AGLY_010096 [Aphis glycines]